MKILVVASRIPYPLKDGGAIAAYNHLKGFAEAGAEVSLFSLNTVKHFVDEATIRQQFGFLKQVETWDIDTGIKPFRALMNLFSKQSYNIERFYQKDIEAALNRHLLSHQYDVIQFEGLYTAMYRDIARRASGSPVVLRQHNVEYQIWQRLAQVETNPLKRWYLTLLAKRLRKFEESVIPGFEAVAAITEADKQVFETLTTAPVICSPAGIDSDHIPVANPSPLVYHIGSMEWMPNCEAMEWFVQSVWPLVLQQCPEAKFYMAGKHMPIQYKSWQSDSVIVAGEVESAAGFIADKGIMVVPLRSGSGIRMKTLEAMAAGKAVVTTSVGLQGIGAMDKTDVLVADDAQYFAEAVIFLVRDAAYRQQLADNARAFVQQHYDNRKLVKNLLDFYKTLGKKS